MKKTWMLLLTVLLCVGLAACTGDDTPNAPQIADTATPTQTEKDLGTMVILFTGDLNGVFAPDAAMGYIGYPALAAYASELDDAGYRVVLVDGGNAYKGGDSERQDIVEAVGYDIRVPGALELSQGVEALPDGYTCWNLAGAAAELEPYTMVTAGEVRVAFLGIMSPAIAGVPQPDSKEAFYEQVQDAIDDAADAGADFVIGVTHLGTDMANSPWTSVEVIANTTGLSAVLDAGSGAVLEGYKVTDKDGFEIPVCAVGSDFCYVGRADLNLNDGTARTVLLDSLVGGDSKVQKLVDKLKADLEAAEDTTPAETTEETTPAD